MTDAVVRDVLLMRLGASRIGIETRYVSEVVRAPHVTRLPGVPPLWRGVINLRGALLPVFDLGVWLHGKRAEDDDGSWIVVLGGGRAELAACVSEVIAVEPLPQDSIVPADAPRLLGSVERDTLIIAGDVLLADPTLILDQGGAHV